MADKQLKFDVIHLNRMKSRNDIIYRKAASSECLTSPNETANEMRYSILIRDLKAEFYDDAISCCAFD